MSLEELLIILQNRVRNLEEAKKQAVISGSVLQVFNIDEDLNSTKISIEQITSIIGTWRDSFINKIKQRAYHGITNK